MLKDYLIKHPELIYPKPPGKRGSTEGIVIHHIAARGLTPQQLHDAEMSRLGGLPYNIYIRQDGTVHEGRGVDKIGAHCTGENARSIGLGFEGYYHPAEAGYKGVVDREMPKAQFDAGVCLIRDLLKEYPSIKWIKSHKAFKATACPGNYFPLDAMVAAAKEEGTAQAAPPATDSGRLLKNTSPMMRGDDVKKLQDTLTKRGYKPGKVDGIYGPITAEAVKAFQRDEKIGVDGIVGPITWSRV